MPRDTTAHPAPLPEQPTLKPLAHPGRVIEMRLLTTPFTGKSAEQTQSLLKKSSQPLRLVLIVTNFMALTRAV